MKHLFTLFCLTCSVWATQAKTVEIPQLYSAEVSTQDKNIDGLNKKTYQIIITSTQFSGSAQTKPFIEISPIYILQQNDLATFEAQSATDIRNPYVIATLLEESLNQNRITKSDVTQYLKNPYWLESFSQSGIYLKLKNSQFLKPKSFHVRFVPNERSEIKKELTGQMYLTGPDISSQQEKDKPAAKLSFEIEMMQNERAGKKLTPYALAMIVEESLNSKQITAQDAIDFFNNPFWHEKYEELPLAKKIAALKSLQ